ncbi:MAG: response regulator transcription factor [Dehalococcoidia bacterium]|nr:response regulator transcription factor [Dehalococcoidia bacterium]
MKLLIVEDEEAIRELISLYLTREGYDVVAVGDGERALSVLERDTFDLVLLDLMLPGIDGFTVCRRVRETANIPIILLTARADNVDKVLGLELGADDYVTKPFNPRELVARVRAVLRRSDERGGTTPLLRVGALTLDRRSREVSAAGNAVLLRTKEFDLLAALMEHAGEALTREHLLSQVWGYDFFGETRTVDVHIQQLRRKIEPSGVHIDTLRGVGYKLMIEVASDAASAAGQHGVR